MPRKTYSLENINGKLRQIEVLIGRRLPGGRHLGAELLPLAQGIWGHGRDPGQTIEGVKE